MRGWTGLLLVAVGLSLAPQAGAQMPQRGARSLQLSGVGRNEVGLWKMVSERTNLGVGVGIDLARRENREVEASEQSTWAVSLVPSVKRYGAAAGPFAPYLFASLPLSLARQSSETSDADGFGIGVAAAVGLDWFPARNVSVGSHVGLLVNRSSTEPEDGAGPESTSTALGTFSSGFTLHLYF